ncbi:MAG: aminopeptidase [Polaribacter sp.]|uniref:aminopeptidase n=1 Tax=Polaribacter sp. TaxID=1920175 RepID=UPI003BB17688
MKASFKIFFFCCFFSFKLIGQQNFIKIKAVLDTEKNVLKIQQEIIYINKSDSILKKMYLHNWANSFKDRKTPLSNRFLEDFKKDFYFAEEEDLGHSKISNITVNNEAVIINELPKKADILEIQFNNSLQPKDSIKINATYQIKIPDARFTGYGKKEEGYFLRYWYLAPAVFTNGWETMSNLNIDDLYEDRTNFEIEIDLPKDYILESNIYQYETKNEESSNYFLVAQSKTDVILGISKEKKFKTFKTAGININTDFINKNINDEAATEILKREVEFIRSFLGKYPHPELFIDAVNQRKNPVIGLSQLPKFIRPFSETFDWEIEMFKSLSRKYIENTLLVNQRKDYWLIDGLQNYLMIEYIEKFYPDVKLLGKVSEYWIIRKFNLAKLKFNDKYPFLYQFSARKFLDQSLTTPSDSLSNFNRIVINKYKAGLGFRYLKGFIGENIFNEAVKEFYQNNNLKIKTGSDFRKVLEEKTSKDLDWFFGDFIQTNKKIDYTLEKVVQNKDSLEVTIKNNRNITTPVSLYGIKDKQIKFKKWFVDIDSVKTVTIAKGDFNRVSLNYENVYPEYNTLDNWKTLEKKIFNKPIKFSLIKDIQDPYYNQLFYEPNLSYNFYNGVILGVKIHNKPIIERNLEFTLAPSYGTKSGTLAGSFSVLYNQFFEETSIYKITYGFAGITLDYAPSLTYSSLVPYIDVIFKRKTLRDTGTEGIRAKLVSINKEVAPTDTQSEQDKYSVFSLNYRNSKLNILEEFGYNIGTEFSKNFSKAYFDIRYRSLTAKNRQLDFRVYGGTFLNNDTTGNYFSFGLDRSNDYLFQLNYFGRSEDSGIFSQQFIIDEGGFKSVLPVRFANQWMLSFNSSIGMWRWLEFYNDVALLKSRNQSVYFAYENGIRFNFVHRILEVYFPVYSNNGWEIGQTRYPEKIRFTLTANVNSIYNFFRRGLF